VTGLAPVVEDALQHAEQLEAVDRESELLVQFPPPGRRRRLAELDPTARWAVERPAGLVAHLTHQHPLARANEHEGARARDAGLH
jgi:hypothetical protein